MNDVDAVKITIFQKNKAFKKNNIGEKCPVTDTESRFVALITETLQW